MVTSLLEYLNIHQLHTQLCICNVGLIYIRHLLEPLHNMIHLTQIDGTYGSQTSGAVIHSTAAHESVLDKNLHLMR